MVGYIVKVEKQYSIVWLKNENIFMRFIHCITKNNDTTRYGGEIRIFKTREKAEKLLKRIKKNIRRYEVESKVKAKVIEIPLLNEKEIDWDTIENNPEKYQ